MLSVVPTLRGRCHRRMPQVPQNQQSSVRPDAVGRDHRSASPAVSVNVSAGTCTEMPNAEAD